MSTTQTPTTDRNAIARAIVTNGHPFTTGWYDDGDVESGPRGGTLYGYRWGQVYISTGTVGDAIFVESRKCGDSPWGKGTGYPLLWGRVDDAAVKAAIDALKRRPNTINPLALEDEPPQ